MDKKFGKANKDKVWQAPDEDAIWDAWCQMTHSTALLENGKIITNKQEIFPVDGSYAEFRSDSPSGGYAIEVTYVNSSQNVWRIRVVRR